MIQRKSWNQQLLSDNVGHAICDDKVLYFFEAGFRLIGVNIISTIKRLLVKRFQCRCFYLSYLEIGFRKLRFTKIEGDKESDNIFDGSEFLW